MQTRNPLLNDFAELMTDAFGAAQAAGEEARSVFRAQTDRIVADMDLVSREEFDALKASANEARDEIEALKARISAMELAAKPKASTRTRKATSKKSTDKSTD
jgi:BMFP domain-containing protein YqiC